MTLTPHSGADITVNRQAPPGTSARQHYLRTLVPHLLNLTHTFYTHPKILITALNGPVVGLSAALIAHSDFIYAAPGAFLLTPFTSLGLVSEGGASRAFVRRLGLSKANEALIMGKRITAREMLETGFVNRIFEVGSEEGFLEEVLKEVEERLGEHLNSDSLLKVKALIQRPEREVLESQMVGEVFAALERNVEGVPQKEFERVKRGEKRHKL